MMTAEETAFVREELMKALRDTAFALQELDAGNLNNCLDLVEDVENYCSLAEHVLKAHGARKV